MPRQQDIKKQTLDNVRACFYDKKIWTKQGIIDATGVSVGTSVNVLHTLMDIGEIRFVGNSSEGHGRKSKQYQLNPDYAHIGELILERRNDTYITYSRIVNLFGNISYERISETKSCSVDDLKKIIKQLMSHTPTPKVLAISIPGVCDKGLIDICDYERLCGFDIGKYITKEYNIAYCVENDANVACIGLSSRFSEKKNIAYLYQPDKNYVGCGMVLNGRLYNGFSHFAGELRYLPLYSHKKQDKLLKSSPQKLLTEQILAVTAVINPDIIGYRSDVFSNEQISLKNSEIPERHLPEIIEIRDTDALYAQGLLAMGTNLIKP